MAPEKKSRVRQWFADSRARRGGTPVDAPVSPPALVSSATAPSEPEPEPSRRNELILNPKVYLDPPRDRWEVVQYQGRDGSVVVDEVPFDGDEIREIATAGEAYDWLAERGGTGPKGRSGPERDFTTEGGIFFTEADQLGERREVIDTALGMSRAARIVIDQQQRPFEPQTEAALRTLLEYPNTFKDHTALNDAATE